MAVRPRLRLQYLSLSLVKFGHLGENSLLGIKRERYVYMKRSYRVWPVKLKEIGPYVSGKHYKFRTLVS
jgi:hypothetical protein